MRRRQFITLLGGAAAWPMAARAQQPKMPVIGFLGSGTADGYANMAAAFRQGLSEAGFSEGRNLAIEYRWADGQYDRLPALVAGLVRQQVAVLATSGGNRSALAAKSATSKIPIVFNAGNDPVQAGLVVSLNHPGGNLTGVYSQASDLVAKTLGLLHELVPKAKAIAVLTNGNQVEESDARDAAAATGLQIRILNAGTESDIETAFANLIHEPADALLVGVDPFFLTRAAQIVGLAARLGVPTIYGRRPFPEAGGLISYGDDVAYSYRQEGTYTGRILKGEKPIDLPIVQTNKFELVINLKTARALGLAIPPTLLALADEVIE